MKKITFRREQTADVGVNATGKRPVENTFHFKGRFCFHKINIMAQNNEEAQSHSDIFRQYGA